VARGQRAEQFAHRAVAAKTLLSDDRAVAVAVALALAAGQGRRVPDGTSREAPASL